MEAELSKKIFSIVCALSMFIIIFPNVYVSADNNGRDVDVFIDHYGNQHKVWLEEIDGIYQIFYANGIGVNNTGIGHTGKLIVTSSSLIEYPQVAVDPVSNICYILWVVEGVDGEEFWYCGSNDLDNWTEAMYGGVMPSVNGNPALDMTADNCTLYVTWKQDGALTIIPDLDGDFIYDNEDLAPFIYDWDGGVFILDAISVDVKLGISVAIDYEENLTEKPLIGEITSMIPLVGSITPYANVTISAESNYSAVIKFRYDKESMPTYVNEKYLRLYAYDDEWRIIGYPSAGEKGGVNMDRNYVWGITDSLSVITVADASVTDLNLDGVPDIWDAAAEGPVESERLTIFSGESMNPKVYISPTDVIHVVWVDTRDSYDNAAIDKSQSNVLSSIVQETTNENVISVENTTQNAVDGLIEPLVGPQPPDSPVSLYVIGTGESGHINIVWGAPISGGAVSNYRIYRSTTDLQTVVIWDYWIDDFNSGGSNTYNIVATEVGSSTQNYVDSDLTDDTDYYYAITARNAVGESDPCINPDNHGKPFCPPYVTSNTPTGSSVSINTNIAVTFNEPMNYASVESAFSISPSLEGSFTWSENTMIFNSFSTLQYSKTYIVTIAGTAAAATNDGDPTTDDVTMDSDGNHRGEGSPSDDYTWTFTTEDSSTTGGEFCVFHKMSVDYGETWTTDTPITTSDYAPVSIDIAGDGPFIGVVWEDQDQNCYFIRSDDCGVSWINPKIIPIDKDSFAYNPSIDWQGDRGYIVYQAVPPPQPFPEPPLFKGISLRWKTPEAIWDVEELFETEGIGIPKIAVDGEDIHVVFNDPTVSQEIRYMHRLGEGSAWSTPIVITSYTIDGVTFSQDSFDFIVENDVVSLVWHDYDIVDSNYNLFYMEGQNKGMDWSSPTQLTFSPDDSLNPEVSIRHSGGDSFYVTWEERSDTSEIYYMELLGLIDFEIDSNAAYEDTGAGNVQGSYLDLQASDGIVEVLREELIEATPNVRLSVCREFQGNQKFGTSFINTFESDDDYEELYLSSELSTHYWFIDASSALRESILTIEGHCAEEARFVFSYSIDGGSTFVNIGEIKNEIIDVELIKTSRFMGSEIIIKAFNPWGFGKLYIDCISLMTQTINSIPDGLEHTWTFQLPTSLATERKLYMQGSMSTLAVTGDEFVDSFLFSYSTDGDIFINMFTVDENTSPDTYLSYELPSEIQDYGTLYIRVVDTNRENSEISPFSIETLTIDHLFIRDTFSQTNIITPSTCVSDMDIHNSCNPAISTDYYGNLYIFWDDNKEGNKEIHYWTDLTYMEDEIDGIEEYYSLLSDEVFASDNVNEIQESKDVFSAKMDLITHMIAAGDYDATLNKINNNVLPGIYSMISDETVKGILTNSINALGDVIEPMAGPQPSTIDVKSGLLGSGTLNIVWGSPTSGGAVSKYRLYICTTDLGNVATWDYWIDDFNSGGSNTYNIALATEVGSGTLGHVDSGLTDETDYYYAVTAKNSEGESDPCIGDQSLIPKPNHGNPFGPPYVTSTVPGNNVQGVLRTSNIQITFNEGMKKDANGIAPWDAGSVEKSFSYTDGTSTWDINDGTASWSGNTLTFNPAGDLAYDTWYTVKILGTAAASGSWGGTSDDDTLDSDGDHTGEGSPTDDYSFQFRTEVNPGAPPKVDTTRISPTGDQVDYMTVSTVTVVFSRAMYHTETQTAFSLMYNSGTSVSGTFSWSDGDKTLTFTPGEGLIEGRLYTVKTLGTAKSSENQLTLDGDNDGIAEGSPTDDYSWQFRTILNPIDVATPTVTSKEYIISWAWTSASSESTTQPYEIYYSSNQADYVLVDTVTSTGASTYTYTMNAIDWNLKPHTRYFFKIKAYNTVGCSAMSPGDWGDSAECGRVDYFLDVGTGNDLPSQLSFMPHYGLTLPPASTGLAEGWSAIFTGADPENWREEKHGSLTKQQFFFNLGNGPELHIDYLLTLRYSGSGSFYLQQEIDEDTWENIGHIDAHTGIWDTVSFTIDHDKYFDLSTAADWYGTNVRFQFSASGVIHLDWIKAEPIAYYADISDSDYETQTSTDYINSHSPGVCLYPGDWSAWDSTNGRLGNTGSRFYVNMPELTQIAIKITYKPGVTGVDGRIKQFDGTEFVEIGNLKTVNQIFYTGVFDMNPYPSNYYDADATNDHFSILFEIDIAIYIKSISIYTDVSEAHKSIPNWVGYYLPTSLSSIYSGLVTHATNMGSYANIFTEVIMDDWATPEELKTELKTEYNHGMVGATLVGNMPMALYKNSISSLFYEDMDGDWTSSSGSYGTGVNPAVNDPELFIGLLRPSTSKNDNGGMALALMDYFTRASNYIGGGWIGSDKALLVQSRTTDLDSTNLKNWIAGAYPNYNEADDYLLSPSKTTVIDKITTMAYDFCIMQAHSWYDEITVNGSFGATIPENKILSQNIIDSNLDTPFYLFTCCKTTAFVESDGNDNVDSDGNYYIAGQFAFDSGGWGLGAFGYSIGASGGTPGAEGLFNSINRGNTIGESIIAWGKSWATDPDSSYPHLGSNEEHYNLLYIGDPLLKL